MMTKKKSKQAEPSTLDRLSAAADRAFGEAFESAAEWRANNMLDDMEDAEQQLPEPPEIEPDDVESDGESEEGQSEE